MYTFTIQLQKSLPCVILEYDLYSDFLYSTYLSVQWLFFLKEIIFHIGFINYYIETKLITRLQLLLKMITNLLFTLRCLATVWNHFGFIIL